MRRRSDNLKASLCQAEQRDLKTIAPLSHRPIVLTDTIGLSVFYTIVQTLIKGPGYTLVQACCDDWTTLRTTLRT